MSRPRQVGTSSTPADSGAGALPGVRGLRRWESTFPLRCAGSFLALQGIDRATAIAAQAFTALIPLLLVVSALSPSDSRNLVSDTIIEKFELRGGAASAVRQLFDTPGETTVGALSLVLLVFSGVSLTRRLQRTYQQAWQLPPVPGIRASVNAAVGLGALVVEIVLMSLVHSLVERLPFGWTTGGLVAVLASVVLWTSVPWLLLDRRVRWRRLLPGGVLTAVCASIYGVATTIYMPPLMATNSERYGLFGVTLSLIGWLLCIALVVVAATAVAGEFDRAPERWARRVRARLGIEPARRDDTAGSSDPAPAAHRRTV
jgi:membrane protein